MQDCIQIPAFDIDLNEQPYRGSWQQLLSNNVGKNVKIDYNISGNILSQQGTVLAVGVQYVLLKNKNCIISGDIFSIKFVTFFCE